MHGPRKVTHIDSPSLGESEIDFKITKDTERRVIGDDLYRQLGGVLIDVEALLEVGQPVGGVGGAEIDIEEDGESVVL